MTILYLVVFLLQSFWWEVAFLGQDVRQVARLMSTAETGFICSDPISSPDVQFTLRAIERVDSISIDQATHIVDARTASLAYTACNVALNAQNQIVVKLVAVDDPAIDVLPHLTNSEIASVLTTGGYIEVIDPRGQHLARGEVLRTRDDVEAISSLFDSGQTYDVLATSAQIADAYPTINQHRGLVLGIEYDIQTGDHLFNYTSQHSTDSLAILIDQKVFVVLGVTAPFGRTSIIEGLPGKDFRVLLAYARSGPLPIGLSVEEVLTSEP